MAGTVQQIKEHSITAITALGKKPVYFLTMANTETLVVKGDDPGAAKGNAAESIHWSSKLMKNVNNRSVNTKPLTEEELEVFVMHVKCFFKEESDEYYWVKDEVRKRKVWVKMPYVGDLTDASILEKKDATAKQVKAFMARFLDEAAWFDLGKVIAVDIFNGTSDRVDIMNRQGQGELVNFGNVMFHNGRVIGLDTFDPASQFNNLVKVGAFQELKILVDTQKQKTFAEACVKSFGTAAKNGFRKHSSGVNKFTLMQPNGTTTSLMVEGMENMYLPYAQSLADGIAAGAQALRQYLQGKAIKYSQQQTRVRSNVQHAGVRANIPRPLQVPIVQPQQPPIPQQQIVFVPPKPFKTIPEGIKKRMNFLGW
jgi:hypothetical protein